MSPVRIIWFAALTCGRRRRAKIMNAFIGRFGVPSAFNVWDVSAWWGSSIVRAARRAVSSDGAGRKNARAPGKPPSLSPLSAKALKAVLDSESEGEPSRLCRAMSALAASWGGVSATPEGEYGDVGW